MHPPDRTDEAIAMADLNTAQESSAQDTPAPDSREESIAEQSARIPKMGKDMVQKMTKNDLVAELAARDAELARLKDDLAARDARIDELFELLADSHNNDAIRSRRRETTAETQTTAVTQQTQQSARTEGEGGRRSGRLPDPPVFRNDEEDRNDFEQWHRDMGNKLRTNADHFRDDQARQAYIESRLGGKAKRELTPYLRNTHPNPITTSSQLMAHLWEQYHDPMATQKALKEYDELKLEPGDDFLSFKNDFVRLAGETGKPRSCWKDEFNRKLYSTFERDMARSYIDPTVSFQEFVREAQQIAMINKRVSERRAAERQPKQKSSKLAANRGPTKALLAKPAADPGKKLSQDEVRILFQEGRCFVCRERGHTSRDCPRKQADDPDREARLKALQEKWAPVTATGTSTGSANTGPVESNRVRFEAASDSEN